MKPNDPKKLNELISIFEVVFELEPFSRPGTAYLQQLLNKETFFALVAVKGQKIIGGLTGYVLDQYYSEKPSAYIYDLAVLPEYQRLGIGKKLISYTNEYCRQRGFKEVFVQAEKVDDQAINFYRSTKPTGEEPVIHFTYNL